MSNKGDTSEHGENLNLRKRRIETLNARIRSPPGLKDKSPDRIWVTR